jgi:voltage-gated potassium channel
MDVDKLREIIEPNVDTRASRAFDLSMMVFIIVAIINFSPETLPGLSHSTKLALYSVEVITVTVFSVEYLLRIITAKKKLRFVFSFFGVIDLLAVIPFYVGLFYLGMQIDLRLLRILRLFRIFRVLKLLRYSRAIKHFRDALNEVREELVLYLMATAFLMYLASAGIYYFERDVTETSFQSIFHSMWWAVVTLTTVGYGDVYPQTTGGKIFTGLILLIGLGVIAIPSGLIASGLTKVKKKQE